MDMGVTGWSRRSGHVLRFFWRILSEKIDVGLEAEDAVAFIAGGFDKDAEAGEAGDQIVSGGVGGACERLDIGDGDDGTLVEGFEDAESVSGSAPKGNASVVNCCTSPWRSSSSAVEPASEHSRRPVVGCTRP